MKGKIIMIENRHVDEDQKSIRKNLNTISTPRKKYIPDGHIKSMKFGGPFQVRCEK